MKEICSNCFSESVNEQGVCTSCGFNCRKNRESHPLALPPGSILYGRYIVGKVLGQGGFGITYLAQDYKTKKNVAIKEFFPDTMATRTGFASVTPFTGDRSEHFSYGKSTFLNEAKTMAEFTGQESIVQVYSYFEENNTGYFVMEYVDGCSLQHHIKQNYGRISWDDTIQIILPVMDALSVMHEKGIIHRDVAPDNIYIKADGTVKLLDFGAARHSLGNVSRSLDVVVKHGFAPKEQYHRHGRQGPFTDVYSVAATIYYAITGARPDDAIERLDEDNLPLPSTLGAKITLEQEDTLLKGIAIKAEDRYQTMAEFREALLATTHVAPILIVIPTSAPVMETKEEVTDPAPVILNASTTSAVPVSANSNTSVAAAHAPVEPGFAPEAAAVVASDPAAGAAAIDVAQEEYDKTVMIAAAATAAAIPTQQEDTAVPPPTPTEPKKKKRGLIFSIIAGVLVCALLAFWFLHPHRYGDWQVMKDATCIEEGQKIRKCFCGNEESQVITKRDHTVVMDAKVNATCTEHGLTEGCHCSVCGAVLVAQQSIPLIDHDIVPLAAVSPTCTECGLTEGAGCSVCGYVEVPQDTIDALGHNAVKDAAVASTCEKEGKTEGSHCSVCGTVLEEQKAVGLANHTPVTDEAVAATCTANGKTEGSHCSVCGTVLVDQESTPKASHTPVTDKAVAATCSSTGKTEGSHCSVCGTVLKSQQTTSKTDHTPTKIAAVAATCTASGLTEGSKCSVCGKVIKSQTKTDALGHSFSGFYCSRCDLKKFTVSCNNSGLDYDTDETIWLTFTLKANVAGATTGIYTEYEIEYDDGEVYSGSLELEGTYGDGDTFTVGWSNGLSYPCVAWIYVYTSDGYYLGYGSAWVW